MNIRGEVACESSLGSVAMVKEYVCTYAPRSMLGEENKGAFRLGRANTVMNGVRSCVCVCVCVSVVRACNLSALALFVCFVCFCFSVPAHQHTRRI